ncbi:MAG: GDSL-type esterase/lipase family protein [Hyphomicrobiaceae bacterium]
MRACLAKLATVATLILAVVGSVRAQEHFLGFSYITPFPADDTYRMQVYGDAFGEGLLAGLNDAFSGEARVQLQRRRRPLAGIMRQDLDDELKTEAASKDTVHIAVVMLGYNDRWSFRISPKEVAQPGSPAWRAEYGRRVDRLAKALKKKGAAVYWVGLPVMRRPEVNEPAQAANDVIREKAYLNGIKYIDITAHFADEAGNYTPYGPDVAGQQRIVRDKDGVLFTWAGYRKLAYFVEREIKRDLALARAERSIPLAGSEAEQKRIAALRPRQPDADAGGKGSPGAGKEGAGKDGARAPTAKAQAGPGSGTGDTRADNSRISLKTVGAGGREETVTLELPRPSIPAAVLQLITRRDTGERASPMGDTLADDVGGLVLLSSVTAGGSGLRRKAAPGQPYYQVWFKGERLTPKAGRSDDFTWPKAEPASETPDRAGSPKASPKG